MQDLNVKQLVLVINAIAEEKNLPEEMVMDVMQQAIAAAWRRENSGRDQDVLAELKELRRVKKAYEQLKLEHDLLKKAIAFTSQRNATSSPSSRSKKATR